MGDILLGEYTYIWVWNEFFSDNEKCASRWRKYRQNIFLRHSPIGIIFIKGDTLSLLMEELARSLSALERKLLPFLSGEPRTLSELIKASNMSDVEVKRALMWLGNRELAISETASRRIVVLGENGKLAKEHGLPELRILKELIEGPKTIDELEAETLSKGEIMACIGILKTLQAANVGKEGGVLNLSIQPAGKVLVEQQLYKPEQFIRNYEEWPVYDELNNEEKEMVEQLSKRKNMLRVVEEKVLSAKLTEKGMSLQGANYDFSDMEEQLTMGMLKTGSWKGKTFRTYDVTAPVPGITGGRRHPLREACNLIRDVYLAMGFQEMSGPWVETAFWCMDSMWIPQDHPARDEQDTFYLGKEGDLPDQEIVDKVKAVHEDGANTGSLGHGSPWNPEIAKQLILRTHSTATTFRMFGLHNIKEDGKYFYIANVFRNEALDATHLPEFLQAEGFVVGDDLSLADLMGFIKEFYARLGIHKIRFKPTYNPYTEPSLEAHYYDEEKGKWYALINSGIFRPESLYPYGIKKSVIAWGMGASRVAALLTGKTHIRDLVGPAVAIDWIATHETPKFKNK